jgi:hypothetical protein
MKLINSLIALTIALIYFGAKQWEGSKNNTPLQTITEAYFLKAKVNGTWIEYTNAEQLSASFGPYIDNVYDGVLSATNSIEDDYSVLNSISIIIRQTGKIGVGSYSGGKQFEYGFKGVTLAYMDSSKSAMYMTDVTNPDSFLKINELTDTFIKGTFSGVLINPINRQKISITDGEFYIKSEHY